MSETATAGLGEILWDVFPTGKVLGGAPSNFAYQLNSLGIDCFPISAVGNDDLGKEIISSLSKKNLSTKYVQLSSNFNTGVVEVTLDDEGKPTYVIKENVAWDNIEYNLQLKQLAKNCSAVCFGSLAQRTEASRLTIMKFLSELPESSLKVFDINLRQKYYSKSVIVESLQLASILKLNDEELIIIGDLLGLKGTDDFLISQIMDNYNLDLITLTKGGKGSVIITPESEDFREPKKINIIDTVGAGDAFTAGMVYGLINNFDLEHVHSISNGLASFVCSREGATPSLDEELKNRIINI